MNANETIDGKNSKGNEFRQTKRNADGKIIYKSKRNEEM